MSDQVHESATVVVPTLTMGRDTMRAKVLFAMSADEDAPTDLDALQLALPTVSYDHLNNTLGGLVKCGAVKRVRRGFYVRLVGETREFRG